MRMIDFRAWDKKKNEILDVMDIDFSGKKVGVCNVPKRMFKDGRLHTIHSIERDWSEVELMQYTGLKDKNGTEIFEGDIVKWSRLCMDFNLENYEERSDNFAVEWDVYNTGFVLGDGEVFLYKDISSELEVIGNIYEDIELLEEI